MSLEATGETAAVAVYVIGHLPPIMGGYAAAKCAEFSPAKHGLATGLALLVFSSVWYVLPDSEFGWSDVVYLALIIPLAWAGSRLCAVIRGLE